MAAGKFHWATTVMKYIATGAIDLQGDAVWAYLLHDGYTPSTASHSAYSDISADIATASATVVNGIALSAKVVTGSGATTVKWDAADIDGFSSDGSTIGSAKYLALFPSHDLINLPIPPAGQVILICVDSPTDASAESVFRSINPINLAAAVPVW